MSEPRKCAGSGQQLPPEAEVDSRGRAPCPNCGRSLKPLLATGGWYGRHPKYYYLPRHNKRKAN